MVIEIVFGSIGVIIILACIGREIHRWYKEKYKNGYIQVSTNEPPAYDWV